MSIAGVWKFGLPIFGAAMFFACSSSAEPWRSGSAGTLDLSDSYSEASQVDGSGRFALLYRCSQNYRTRYFFVFTSEAMDMSADYAPEVPLSLSVDGGPPQSFIFKFQMMPHYPRVKGAGGKPLETVYIDTMLDPAEVNRFATVAKTAKKSLSVSYFDKSATFSADGIAASFSTVEAGCP